MQTIPMWKNICGLVAALLLLGSAPPPGDRPPETGIAATATRRVNVWPGAGSQVDDNTASIFWFGHETDHNLYNYVDVRVGYTSQHLRIFVTVVDYNLWQMPSEDKDPRLYDGVAIYLDTAGDRATAPQPDDYFFVNSWRHSWPGENKEAYHRDGRGTGSGWNEAWSGTWTETVGANWYNTGPNNNGNCPSTRSDCDAGWSTVITIPFSTLGLAGPPPSGTIWGLGLYIYDRDAPEPAALVSPPPVWPETLSANNPGTWGEIAFNPPRYSPPSAVPTGTTVVRRDLGGTVADAYVGGDGNCDGGYLGGGDVNHGDEGLFVASQSLIADFPCWSKSYLKFGLGGIPPGKVILSATLTLHLWGNAGYVPSQAPPSYTHLFTVAEDWDEHTIIWNTAPMAKENLTATWVYPRTDSGPDFPGIPYTWDATQAVAEAYAAGRPLNVALYTSDTNFHSSKYYVSSDADSDWIPVAKPTLTVLWGDPAPGIEKQVSRSTARTGDPLTYTLRLLGAGTTLYLRDPIPNGTAYRPGSVTGGASYNPAANRIEWTGALSPSARLTITFGVTVTATGPLAIVNTATLTDGVHPPLTASATTIVNGFPLYLPLVLRAW
ncbi:MAG: DNRLRE domain-containing protein [Thermoflexales bacterium]|nr:DNRLRE domain-containing protein [Thermoflexales bacterium]